MGSLRNLALALLVVLVGCGGPTKGTVVEPGDTRSWCTGMPGATLAPNCRYGPESAEAVQLLTGGSAGCSAGPQPVVEGPLLADPKNGTAIQVERSGIRGGGGPNETLFTPPNALTEPVMWPTGFTGRRTSGGEVEVLDDAGRVVATTGKRYVLAAAPLMNTAGTGAFGTCGLGELGPEPT